MPRKIAIGPYDDIVVADKINNRVQVFMADGTFIQSYGGEDDNAGVVCDGPVGVMSVFLMLYTVYLLPYKPYLIPYTFCFYLIHHTLYVPYAIPYTVYLLPYTPHLVRTIHHTAYLLPYTPYLIHTVYRIPYTPYLIPDTLYTRPRVPRRASVCRHCA
jgi:hypothetical protein